MDKYSALHKIYQRIKRETDDYLTVRNDEYDKLQILFILMAVKNKVKLNFTDNTRQFFDENADAYVSDLYYVASAYPNQVFDSLQGLYEELLSLKREEFMYVYKELLYDSMLYDQSASKVPPYTILYMQYELFLEQIKVLPSTLATSLTVVL